MKSETEWLELELTTGIQKLLCLGLEGQPAGEVLPGTVAAWLEAITDGRLYDEHTDAERFRTAFRTLARTITRWPQPRHLLEAMPKRAELIAIGRDRKCSPEVAAENLRRIGELVGKALDATTPPYKREAS